MIHPERVRFVKQLLREKKHSLRAISRLAGVSRGSVGAIASGRRPEYAPPSPTPEDDSWRPTGPITRCPNCGGRVYAPCRLCHVRDQASSHAPRSRRIPGR